jgi:hypothetical protein
MLDAMPNTPTRERMRVPLPRRFRPTPALVVATVALLVALGGTSAAAVALIPRNSVGSNQVIDGSLRSRDLASGLLPAPTEAFSRSIAGPLVLQTSDNQVSVATLAIPRPGHYLIWAKARLTVDDDRSIDCDLVAAGHSDSSETTLTARTPGASVNATLSNVVVQDFADAGSVELQCGTYTKGKRFAARDVEIVALRVAASTVS